MELLFYFGSTMLVTILVTALLCRYRITHERQIAFGTVLASSVIANVIVVLSFSFYEEGWHLLTREAWTGGKGGLVTIIYVFGTVTIMGILPALGVAAYYERRSQKVKTLQA